MEEKQTVAAAEEKVADKPAGELADKPGKKPAEKPGKQPAEKPAVKAAINIPALIRSLVAVAASVFMTYMSVWWEFNWMANAKIPRTYAGMMRFYLQANDGANKELFYSLWVCGLVLWTVLAFALIALGRKAFNLILAKIRKSRAAKAK